LKDFLQLSSSEEASSSDAYDHSDEERKLTTINDWTRVKSRAQFTAKNTTVFDHSTDLKALLAEKIKDLDPKKQEELVLFDPDVFKDREQELKMEANTLSIEQLLDYGKMVTKVRADIEAKAKVMEES